MSQTTKNSGIQLHKNRKGEFYFKKFSKNGKQIGKSSEGYNTRRSALAGIKADALITLRSILPESFVKKSALLATAKINYTDMTKPVHEAKYLYLQS